MTTDTLPIFGRGSQPSEPDGAEFDYLSMPNEMLTYAMPRISTSLNSPALSAARQLSIQLQANLDNFPAAGNTIDLLSLDDENRQFIDELLGEGEVAVLIDGGANGRVQESILAGVWRLQHRDSLGGLVKDSLEVGAFPPSVAETAFAGAAPSLDVNMAALPEGVMNAPPLIAELNAHIASYQSGHDAHVINLSLLPQTEQDLVFLDQSLGRGKVTILSRGYGNCRITATATTYVWWVQYYNSQDTLILNTLEICDIPSVAQASAEDIADSSQRLREIVGAYS
ncbi:MULTISPECIES: hydrogenase expression/formation protein [unclassified Methylomonas]|uniref:hydrogenase expression/formation protein n=1 Tax=unclassified Methylomonas TaxID=2608980 RepID=UPI0008D939E2|nr:MULTISPECIES: hydrogenase expression/formation protein [unclassified Methylomonas]MDT4328334.1 hydrogenase expression/formation protein [Methylomonas sp. MV1]OHX37224.1 hydrogenase expression/formation protein [Methylomonas sp. LWB]WGS88366.1 hydrogenase expression/formation protein [Methylomonas sp. UP202]